MFYGGFDFELLRGHTLRSLRSLQAGRYTPPRLAPPLARLRAVQGRIEAPLCGLSMKRKPDDDHQRRNCRRRPGAGRCVINRTARSLDTVMLGDCVGLMSQLEAESIDFALTDRYNWAVAKNENT